MEESKTSTIITREITTEYRNWFNQNSGANIEYYAAAQGQIPES